MLGSALAGAALPEADAVQARWPAARHGGMIMAIHIDTVVPDASFRQEVDRFVKDIRETYTPMPGYDETLLPGAMEEKKMKEHRMNGIRFGEMEQTAVREMSGRMGEPVPWEE